MDVGEGLFGDGAAGEGVFIDEVAGFKGFDLGVFPVAVFGDGEAGFAAVKLDFAAGEGLGIVAEAGGFFFVGGGFDGFGAPFAPLASFGEEVAGSARLHAFGDERGFVFGLGGAAGDGFAIVDAGELGAMEVAGSRRESAQRWRRAREWWSGLAVWDRA